MCGCVYQYRQEKWRHIALEHIGKWEGPGRSNNEKPLDLPTFKRYCEGCGLTVKEVKPEPAVETIKPPEWAMVWPDGALVLSQCVEQARADDAVKRGVARIVRIDWGAK